MFILIPFLISTYSGTITTSQNFITIDDIDRVFVFPSEITEYPSQVFFETGDFDNMGVFVQDPYMKIGGVGFLSSPLNDDVESLLNSLSIKTAPIYRLFWGNGGLGFYLGGTKTAESDENQSGRFDYITAGISKRFRSLLFSFEVSRLTFDRSITNTRTYSDGDYSYGVNLLYRKETEFFEITPFFTTGYTDLSRLEGDEFNVVEHGLTGFNASAGFTIRAVPFESSYIYIDFSAHYTREHETYYDTTDLTTYGLPVCVGMEVRKGRFIFRGAYKYGIFVDKETSKAYRIEDNLKLGVFFSLEDLDIGGVLNNKLLTDGPYFITGQSLSKGPFAEFSIVWRFRNL